MTSYYAIIEETTKTHTKKIADEKRINQSISIIVAFIDNG